MRRIALVSGLLFLIAMIPAVFAAGPGNPRIVVEAIVFYDDGGNEVNWTVLDHMVWINVTVRNEEDDPGPALREAYTARNVYVTFKDGNDQFADIAIGDIPPEEIRRCEVNWTADLPVGDHTIKAELRADNSDDTVPGNRVIRVERAEPDIYFRGDTTDSHTIRRGQVAYYYLIVANNGTREDTISLEVSEFNANAWDVTLLDTKDRIIESVDLDAGATTEIKMKVKATNAGSRDVANVIVYANSTMDQNASASVRTVTRVAADILLIIDSTSEEEDRLSSYFEHALEYHDYLWDLMNTREMSVDAEDMITYDVVIWSSPSKGLSGDEIDALKSYLDAGTETSKKSLFLTGQNVAESLNRTSKGRDFLRNYLRVRLSMPYTEATTLTGTSETIIGGGLTLDISETYPGSGGARNQDSPDNITLLSSARTVFNYDAGCDIGASFYTSEGYNVLFFSFGFEGINDEDTRYTLMGRILYTFQGGMEGYVKTQRSIDGKVRYVYIDGAKITLVGTSYATTTDERGHYIFTGLAPGTYTVRVRAGGYENPVDKVVNVYKGAITEVEDFVLNIKPARIKGWIRDQHDRPVRGAQINLTGWGTLKGVYFLAHTDEDGYYSVNVGEGTYNLSVSRRYYWTATVVGISAYEGHAPTVQNITLWRMRHPGNLTGYASDSLNTPLAGLEVHILDNLTVRTGADGIFPVVTLPAGVYNVTFHVVPGTPAYEKHLGDNSTLVEVIEGKTVWANVTLRGASGRIRVYVKDQYNQPIEGATVRLKDKVSGQFVGSSGTTGQDGYVVISDVPVGDYYVYAWKSGYRKKYVPSTVYQGKTSYAELLLPPGMELKSNLQVNVTSSTGLPLGGLLVSILGTDINDTTFPSGRALFLDVPAGIYDVHVSGKGILPETVRNVEIAEIQGTWNYLDIVVELVPPRLEGYVISNDTRRPLEGARIDLFWSDNESIPLSAVSDAEGHYSFLLDLGPYSNYTGWFETILYTVNCSADGYNPVVSTFEAGPGDEIWMNFTLVNSTPPVVKHPPVADAGDDMTVKVKELVKFDAAGSYDSDGEIVRFIWIIQGTEVEGSEVYYKFLEPGTYNVTLRVIDDDGLADDDTIMVIVERRPSAEGGEGGIPGFEIAIAIIAIIAIGLIVYMMRTR